MDPSWLQGLGAILGPLIQSFGNQGGSGSTYNKGQRSFIDNLLDQVKGMGNQDITQNQNFQQGQGYLDSLFNDDDFFNSLEAPLQRGYEENVANLATRFGGQGSGGSTGSTGFRNAANREASNLSTNLGAMRTGLQSQGANQALQYSQAPFNQYMQLMQGALTPTKNTYQQSSY